MKNESWGRHCCYWRVTNDSCWTRPYHHWKDNCFVLEGQVVPQVFLYPGWELLLLFSPTCLLMTNAGSQVMGRQCPRGPEHSKNWIEINKQSQTPVWNWILIWQNWSHIPTDSSTSPKNVKNKYLTCFLMIFRASEILKNEKEPQLKKRLTYVPGYIEWFPVSIQSTINVCVCVCAQRHIRSFSSTLVQSSQRWLMLHLICIPW